MVSDPVASLLSLAAAQRGAFRSDQAAALGWSERARKAARQAEWRQIGRGVYVHAFVWAAFSADDRHLCQTMARILETRSGWHAARRTAAVAHDLPMLGNAPTVPQLLRDHLSSGRANAVSRHERVAEMPGQDRMVVGGLPSASRARTVADIARRETFMSAVVVADGALRAGTSRAELKECAARCASWPGGLQAMRVAEFADGLSESVLESISRVRMDERRLPQPELQVEVYLGEELLARLDFLWRQYNAVGLADGALKYDSREQVMAEKWTIERLEDVGLEVARWGWDSAYRDRGDLEYKVRRVLERGACQLLDPRVQFVRTTIERNLRANERAAARRTG